MNNFFFYIIFFLGLNGDHALHLSTSELIFDEKASTVELSVKVFQNDLQSALINQNKQQQNINREVICDQHDNLINHYFNDFFKCMINESKVDWYIQDCQPSADIFTLKFSAVAPKEWTSIRVEAIYFMELFDDQNNILTLRYDDKKEINRFHGNAKTYQFEIN